MEPERIGSPDVRGAGGSEDGEPVYRIVERYLGKTVWTDFWPEALRADSNIMGVDILFPLG